MTCSPKDIITSFCQGVHIEHIDADLIILTKTRTKHALDVFAEEQCAQETLIQILESLKYTHKNGKIKGIIDHYNTVWLPNNEVSHNLVHFLEFLVQHEDHRRIAFLLERIHETKNPVSYAAYFFSGALLSCIGASIYFYLTDSWNSFLNFITLTIPQIGKWFLENILLTQNLSIIILAYQFIKTFFDFHHIYIDRTTSDPKKFIKIATVALLTMTAQALSFLYINIARFIPGLLLIIASSIESIWLFIELLYKPDEKDQRQIDAMSTLEQIKYFELKAMYEKTKTQFYYELISWALITTASIIGFIFAPYLPFIGTMIVVFQFLVSSAKHYYYNQLNEDSMFDLQKIIQGLNSTGAHDGSQVVNDASSIRTHLNGSGVSSNRFFQAANTDPEYPSMVLSA